MLEQLAAIDITAPFVSLFICSRTEQLMYSFINVGRLKSGGEGGGVFLSHATTNQIAYDLLSSINDVLGSVGRETCERCQLGCHASFRTALASMHLSK